MTMDMKEIAAACAAMFMVGVLVGRIGAKPAASQMTKTASTAETSKSSSAVETTKDVNHKDVTITTTSKADGTKTTVVVDHSIVVDKVKETASATEVSKSSTVTTVTSFAPDNKSWSLGLSYAPSYALRGQAYSPDAFTPEVGMRLFGGLWVEAAFHMESRTPVVGIRWEF